MKSLTLPRLLIATSFLLAAGTANCQESSRCQGIDLSMRLVKVSWGAALSERARYVNCELEIENKGAQVAREVVITSRLDAGSACGKMLWPARIKLNGTARRQRVPYYFLSFRNPGSDQSITFGSLRVYAANGKRDCNPLNDTLHVPLTPTAPPPATPPVPSIKPPTPSSSFLYTQAIFFFSDVQVVAPGPVADPSSESGFLMMEAMRVGGANPTSVPLPPKPLTPTEGAIQAAQ